MLQYWLAFCHLLSWQQNNYHLVQLDQRRTCIWCRAVPLQHNTSLLLPLWQHGMEMKNRHPLIRSRNNDQTCRMKLLTVCLVVSSKLLFPQCLHSLEVASDVGFEEILKCEPNVREIECWYACSRREMRIWAQYLQIPVCQTVGLVSDSPNHYP